MKTKFFFSHLLLLLVLFLPTIVFGQPIMEHFGGTKVNFEISTLKTNILNNTTQYLVLRANKESETKGFAGEEYGFGYGFQSIHLEFEAKEPIRSYVEVKLKRQVFQLMFYDKDEKEIGSKQLSRASVKKIGEPDQGTRIYYSIDLKAIPLIILDKTNKIDISIIEGY